MGMYHGMDLSAFKKVKSDDKTTTLRHAKGHEIRIAHKSLTPKLKGMLDGLQMFAEKGDVEDPSAMDPDSPAQADDDPDDTPVAAPDDAPTAASSPQDNQPPVGNMVMDNAPPNPPPQAPNAVDQIPSDEDKGGNTVTTMAPARMPNPQETAAQKDDIVKGNVAPQTLQGLYNSKDTTGKIGMIIGTLLGGIGSGLTKQPNALLGMLNDQINRDLQAQTTSSTNAQNWYKINQQNELNQASIGQTKEHTKALVINNASNQMGYDALRIGMEQAGRLPPAYQPGGVNLIKGTLEPWADNRAANGDANTANSVAQMYPPKYENGVDRNRVEGAAMMAGVKFPGAPEGQTLRDQAGTVQYVRSVQDEAHSAFDNLNTMTASQLGDLAGAPVGAVTHMLSSISALAPVAGGLAAAANSLTGTDKTTYNQLNQKRNALLAPVAAKIGPMVSGSVQPEANQSLIDAKFPTIYDLAAPDINDLRKQKLQNLDEGLRDYENRAASTLKSFAPDSVEPFKMAKYKPIDTSIMGIGGSNANKPSAEEPTDTAGDTAPAGLTEGMTPAQLQNKMRGK
jgi:hypothetical protein